MKILRVHFAAALVELQYKFSISSSQHEIERMPDSDHLLIDKRILVPFNNIKEIVLDIEPTVEPVTKPTKPKKVKESV